ncbi:MAG: moeB [Microbacteriaceae bacterium]|nr:moeB [Microbacteriaceae bacterium]HEV7956390.1 molybdopterin-synthase adenylyltransferase MoeB [Marisediminicola sp.]
MPLPPLVEPLPELSVEQVSRASRHLMLPGLGLLGQRRLAAARVLVIGAGGLGSPVLQYLAAAGIGVIGIVDFDTVDLSNLQRQVIHGTADVGELKTVSAARSIAALNPLVDVVRHSVRLDRDNALDLFSAYDLVIDGSDNFATRYLANDAAAILGKPYVWGSVYRFDGQVTVFWESAPDDRGLDYRDLHPVPPAPGEVLSCDEAGVLGAVCATIGAMMATEAMKLITGLGEPLLGRVQILDALAGDWREVRLVRRAGRIPVSALIDYDEFCGVTAANDALSLPPELLRERGTAGLIDVREPFEHEIVHIDGDRLVPLARLLENPQEAGLGPVVVYCKTGLRSLRAAEALRAAGIDAVSLRGGIHAWLDLTDPDGPRY